MIDKVIIGIDGGASKTSGVIFNEKGETLAHESGLGTNLSIDEKKSAERVVKLIKNLLEKTKININDISSIGIGLAGASNEIGRQTLFGLLDNVRLSDKTIITNDVDPLYDFIWSGVQKGILVNVGTGVICMSKKDNNFIKVAGQGHEKGDVGSGYWIAKESLIEIELNQSAATSEIKEILSLCLEHYQIGSYASLMQKIDNSDEKIAMIASFAKKVILLASQGNECAVSIVQQATRIVAEYIIEVRDLMDYGDNDIILSGNGSVLRNDYFRSELNNALSFDFKNIKWIFSDIYPAYAMGTLAARIHKIDIDRKKLNRNALKVEK